MKNYIHTNKKSFSKFSKKEYNLSDFGKKLFNDVVQKELLTPEVYKELRATILEGAQLKVDIAQQVAHAIKVWAISNGASHYTHWFQPLTGGTAEKHDSFLDFNEAKNPITKFSGSQLIMGEPDASSFPSGGMRQVFEARGYTAWDPTSPIFILESDLGKTVYIPTTFCSYSGDSLDMKTPLLRSQEALSNTSKRLLKILGREVTSVFVTVGLEQEYFLVDSELYNKRPDLKACGRTLIGNSPLKGQELSDHYFGTINPRVLNFIQESEKLLNELGVPTKTRHKEVAPSQYELASIFSRANLAIDQNLLTMRVMKEIAIKHGFRMLTHEKPFKGINGSGKHCNWSLQDSDGQNLLEPGETPEKNLEFIVFLSAVLRSIDRWSPLLRISIASASNDHRLGAHEAPPAVLSIFLGDQLTEIIDSLIENRKTEVKTKQTIKLGVSSLPNLPKDNSDRNRTSPFAFTGNKFEFRALGAKQNSSSPNYTLNLAMTESLDFIASEIEKKIKKGIALNAAVQETIAMVLTEHRRIVFNGDGYSEDWMSESKKRGLPNLLTLVDAVKFYDAKESIELFEKYGVLNRKEITARKNVRLERYNTECLIEVKSILEIAKSMILPAAYKHQTLVSKSISNLKKTVDIVSDYQIADLKRTSKLIDDLLQKINILEEKSKIEKESPAELAQYILDSIKPAMLSLRITIDEIEKLVDDTLWPLPKYRELLAHVF